MPKRSNPRNLSRRAVLAAAGVGAGAGIASALSGSEDGNLYGGTMALNEAYNVSGDLYIGPDSAKSNIDAKSGRIYTASDTQVDYYGDSGSWVKMGIGSDAEKVPNMGVGSLNADEATINHRLQNKDGNRVPASVSPPALDFGFSDDFEDGTRSGTWLFANSVSESSGSVTISDGTNRNNALVSTMRYGRDVVFKATLSIASGGKGEMQLDRSVVPTGGSIVANGGGGALLAIDTGGSVDFNTAAEDATYDSNVQLSSTQGASATDFTVSLAYTTSNRRGNHEFRAKVKGNGETNSYTREFTSREYSGPMRAKVAENGSGSVTVKDTELVAPPTLPRELQVTRATQAMQEWQVSDSNTPDFYPKEAGGIKVGDTYYAVVAGWNAYSSPGHKDLVLMATKDPFGYWKQVSEVTASSDSWHASGITYNVKGNNELWIVANNSANNDAHLLHAPVNDIPESPSGWTDDGQILSNCYDTKTILNHNGEWYVFFQDSPTTGPVAYESGPDLNNLSGRTTVFDSSDDDSNFGDNQAIDVFQGRDGSWYMTTFYNSGVNGSLVARSDTIDGTYQSPWSADAADILSSDGNINQQVVDADVDTPSEWYGDWTAHFSTIKRESADGLATHEGYFPMLFEGGDGAKWSVGVAGVPVSI